jgi:hypothetical protein
MKVLSWTKEEWKSNLKKRLHTAKRFRGQFERVWRENEKILFTDIGQYPDQIVVTEENLLRFDTGESEVGADQLGINYAWKYLRFLHSQMSANPPSVLVRPATTDVDDRRSADAADRIAGHLRRTLRTQEVFDACNLNALTYGNGFIKTVWDPNGGEEPIDFIKETNEIIMPGDFLMYAPDIWNIWFDQGAEVNRDVRFCFEKHEVPIEEAQNFWPDQKDALDRYIRVKDSDKGEILQDPTWEEVVEIFEYHEKGMPINGMVGRHAWHLEDGTVLGEPEENPHWKAKLPLHIMGDADLPSKVYNKSFVEYISKLQDVLNRLDSTILDNVEASAVCRVILPEGAEMDDEAMGNHAWDITKMTGGGGQTPHYMNPAQMPQFVSEFRQQVISGMQEMAGINDSMLGNIPREMSGFSIQTAIDAGNTVRRRLFNKYTMLTEDVFKHLIGLAQMHWDEKHKVRTIGKERAFETKEFDKADIAGGYDFVGEYGASLSLDPARRREEIQQLKPDLKEAGVSPKTLVGMYRLNELDSIYDRVERAALRAREVVDKIIDSKDEVEIREMGDHAGMLEFFYEYVTSAEYDGLPDDIKDLIDEHVRKREKLAAQVATTGKAPVKGAAEGGEAEGQPGIPPPAVPEGAPPEAAEEPPSLAAVAGGGAK